MRSPRLTIRARLTAVYALLVALSTGILLLVSYWLLGSHFDRTLPAPLADDALDEVAVQYAVAFLGVVVLATAVGWAIAGHVLAPLKRITATARRVSEQRLGERIPVGGPDDELRELGETLNSMLDRLADSFDSQRRFVANASHELRGPLTVIRSEAEVPLAAAEGVQMTSQLDAAPVEGDGALLERLAANLVENGLRYNRPGGFVEVSTRAGVGSVELRVENSGPPVDRGDATRLAEPFERLPREADRKGAGLGLSIVRAVSEAHGGSVAIDPRNEGGLVVSVRLPRAAARPDAARDSHLASR